MGAWASCLEGRDVVTADGGPTPRGGINPGMGREWETSLRSDVGFCSEGLNVAVRMYKDIKKKMLMTNEWMGSVRWKWRWRTVFLWELRRVTLDWAEGVKGVEGHGVGRVLDVMTLCAYRTARLVGFHIIVRPGEEELHSICV